MVFTYFSTKKHLGKRGLQRLTNTPLLQILLLEILQGMKSFKKIRIVPPKRKEKALVSKCISQLPHRPHLHWKITCATVWAWLHDLVSRKSIIPWSHIIKLYDPSISYRKNVYSYDLMMNFSWSRGFHFWDLMIKDHKSRDPMTMISGIWWSRNYDLAKIVILNFWIIKCPDPMIMIQRIPWSFEFSIFDYGP